MKQQGLNWLCGNGIETARSCCLTVEEFDASEIIRVVGERMQGDNHKITRNCADRGLPL